MVRQRRTVLYAVLLYCQACLCSILDSTPPLLLHQYTPPPTTTIHTPSYLYLLINYVYCVFWFRGCCLVVYLGCCLFGGFVMPVYEYVCSRCGPFESWDYGLVVHLVCGGGVERVFVPPGVGRVRGGGGSPSRPSGKSFRVEGCCEGGCDCE